jgi:hypothetical protein
MSKRDWRCRLAVGAVAVLCAALGMMSCEDDTADPGAGGWLSDVTVQVLDGYIAANLQPVVLPDPILCTLTLRIVNSNAAAAYGGLYLPSAEVFLSKNSVALGTIRFETDWDGAIAAGAMDTVTVTKIQEGAEIFDPPCGEHVYLRVRIARSTVQSKTFSTPSYGFACPVNAGKND